MTNPDLKDLRQQQEIDRLTTVVAKRDAKTERLKARLATLTEKENHNDTD